MNFIEEKIKDPFGDGDVVRCKTVSNGRAKLSLGQLCPNSEIKKDLELLEFKKFTLSKEMKEKTKYTDGLFDILQRESLKIIYDNYDSNTTSEYYTYFVTINLSENHSIPRLNRIWKETKDLGQYDYLDFHLKRLFINNKYSKNMVCFYEKTKKEMIHCHLFIVSNISPRDIKIEISDILNISRIDIKYDIWYEYQLMNTKTDLYNTIQYIINKGKHIYEVINWLIYKPFYFNLDPDKDQNKNIELLNNNDDWNFEERLKPWIKPKSIKPKPTKKKIDKKNIVSSVVENEIIDLNIKVPEKLRIYEDENLTVYF